jgi:hypothetical protein
MDRGFSAFFVGGAAQHLAVNGDHIHRRAGQLGDPGDEATLEFRGIERSEKISEVVVRRRPIAERQEPAQKPDFLLAEPCDIDEGFCPPASSTLAVCHAVIPPNDPAPRGTR